MPTPARLFHAETSSTSPSTSQSAIQQLQGDSALPLTDLADKLAGLTGKSTHIFGADDKAKAATNEWLQKLDKADEHQFVSAEGLKALESLGIIRTRHGEGVFVAHFSFDPIVHNLPYSIAAQGASLPGACEFQIRTNRGRHRLLDQINFARTR